MDSINVRKIEIIVKELLAEFEKESSKLQTEYDDNVARILEIEENIHNYKENEDVDFQVFSPRKIDNQNEAKIENMNKEKENIELSNKSLYRQIKYYSDKKDKLNEILKVIDEDRQMPGLSLSEEKKEMDDITHVDEKILAYYDSIASNPDEEASEKIDSGEEIIQEKDTRSGWRLIKDELDSPLTLLSNEDNNEDDEDTELEETLRALSEKLMKESSIIEEDYLKTKAEIKEVISNINNVLEKIKK